MIWNERPFWGETMVVVWHASGRTVLLERDGVYRVMVGQPVDLDEVRRERALGTASKSYRMEAP